MPAYLCGVPLCTFASSVVKAFDCRLRFGCIRALQTSSQIGVWFKFEFRRLIQNPAGLAEIRRLDQELHST